MKTFTDQNFKTEVIAASNSMPVLVMATASWCGPCKQLHPVVDAIAAEMGGRYSIGKLDIDSSPNTASALGIKSVPTLVVFKDGIAIASQAGVMSRQRILRLLEGKAA
jgi:thioredoxin